MKKNFPQEPITRNLKKVDAEIPPAEVCRKRGVNAASYYQWISKIKWNGIFLKLNNQEILK
ncbi:Uncharacterized protein PRO82_000338 [Candidatus Protochlamydia amoebophila]|uniref:transposase n=1 Tax=Candidatus Protochlamydia amoebophila TaxID=362787 RepID=UPI001BC9F969|nr:transposase [Candidatus Protochlamydia amoebophila]MBS4163049.1 Uncharacterized protein [Candidatus Protochlamydia amoebophila]